MKGLILAGGAGTRLRPITHTSAKQLVPIANKPILFYVVEDMAAAGIKDIGVVVSPDSRGRDRSRAGRRLPVRRRAHVHPAGPSRSGSRTACSIAADFLGDDDFVMYLGDNMLQQRLRPLVDRFVARAHPPAGARTSPHQQLPAAQILLAHVDDPRQFGVAEIDAHGGVVRLVEKPADPPSDLALAGVYIFDRRVHEAVNAIRAVGAGRARDHRRDPVAHRPRLPGHARGARRLVDRHRQEGPAAALQPARPRHDRTAHRRRARRRFARRRSGRDRGRRAPAELGRARARDHRRRHAASSTPMSVRTPRSAPTASCATPRSNTRWCSSTAASSACTAFTTRCSAARSRSCAPASAPRPPA